MFKKTAQFYDAIYSWKDYAGEAERLHDVIISSCSQRPAHSLLDVACGTGAHLAYLQGYYAVEGVDLDPDLLAIARERLPGVTFTEADMLDFDLGRRFDVVACLFSSIGYAKTVEGMRRAVATMARHLNPGGVLIIEPWLKPEDYREGYLSALFADQPDLKIARMNTSVLEDGMSILNFNYLIGLPSGIEYTTERHELGLFTHEQYMQALTSNGLNANYDPTGLMGRGLYVAIARGWGLGAGG